MHIPAHVVQKDILFQSVTDFHTNLKIQSQYINLNSSKKLILMFIYLFTLQKNICFASHEVKSFHMRDSRSEYEVNIFSNLHVYLLFTGKD